MLVTSLLLEAIPKDVNMSQIAPLLDSLLSEVIFPLLKSGSANVRPYAFTCLGFCLFICIVNKPL